MRICAAVEHFPLGSALSKKIGTGESSSEHTDAGENSDERDDYSKISGLAHLKLPADK